MNVDLKPLSLYPLTEQSRRNFPDCNEQVQKYRELIESVCPIKGLMNRYSGENWESAKKSIAFLVEASKQLDHEHWQENLSDLRNRIIRLNDLPEVSWVLSECISGLYQASLKLKLLEAKREMNCVKSNEFMVILSLLDIHLMLAKNLHKEGKAVSLNFIKDEFVPHWYS